MEIPTKKAMNQCYFDDPKKEPYIKTINNASVKYYYFSKPINISNGENEVSDLCLLKGTSNLIRNMSEFVLDQFDMVFLPKNEQIEIKPTDNTKLKNKICIVNTPILREIGQKLGAQFEIQRFSFDKFIPRGEFGDSQKISTYREVWTAINNRYFMAGFTNIPRSSLVQGVVTSVNLENEDNLTKIFSHIHPEYPEIYIYCIDDPSESVAVTQFLINTKGQSIARDLTDGEGILFDGSLGHINFTKPTYKKMKYCLYMWMIPTFGKIQNVDPITLRF